MHTVDLVNLSIAKLTRLGIDLRFINGEGLSSSLCRLNDRHILFINDGATVSEQMQIIANAFAQLKIDLSLLPTPLRAAIEARLVKDKTLAV